MEGLDSLVRAGVSILAEILSCLLNVSFSKKPAQNNYAQIECLLSVNYKQFVFQSRLITGVTILQLDQFLKLFGISSYDT